MRNHRITSMFVLVLVASCATTSQPRVGKAGVYCSESVGYAAFDFVVAAALLYGAQQMNAAEVESGAESSPTLYLPGGIFAASGVHGLIKRSNCIRHRRNAPPEAWIADRRRAEEDDRETSALWSGALAVGGAVVAAGIAAEAEAEAEESASSTSTTPSPYVSSSSRRRVTSTTLTINGTTYTDGPAGELGKPCSLERNTCSSGYLCRIVVGTSGQCVPK